ncbi:carbon-nitrogen family hydrolase [Ruania alkalisoli]|uniref:Carbon-nitrogen family hydrolase n=1 Tax=Ruania alkalisoli TaxID=2779775 RepID=A0A7M1SS01_9MICO|nr:carbon-nitrogen family hydrolase [Ruania alkalisoli]QOR69363.1 carbon-nitrogen family hydrolase [Ruania alkalisoli]
MSARSPHPSTTRIGLVQIASPDEESPETRRERVHDMIADLPDCDLIVLPELWAPGYFAFDHYRDRAELLDGPTITGLAEIARQRETYVHAGSVIEEGDGGRLRNTTVLLDPAGQIAASYSKIHVFGYQSAEAQLLEPGTSVSVTDSPVGRTAATTCYDLRFPGLWQRISDLGATAAIVPAAWPHARLRHWRLFTSVRAVEHQLFVIACNAAGTQAGTQLGGHSRVVDPWGEVLLELDEAEQVAVCEITPSQVADVRHEFPVLADRLPSYAAL